MHGFPEPVAAVARQLIPISEPHRALMAGERFTHILDIGALPLRPNEVMRRAMLEHTAMRTVLAVPLRKDGAFIGQITGWREGTQPFAENKIALLESFAAQAVIAMENARLLGELRERTEELAERNVAFSERIEHQAATIDVLKEMSACRSATRSRCSN